jgi:hypothetical protein
MPNQLAIRLSDGPADQLVRIHTERTDWDEPEVRYLRRNRPGRGMPRPLRLYQPDGSEEIVMAFGNVHVRIYANEDNIQIALCEAPHPPRAA